MYRVQCPKYIMEVDATIFHMQAQQRPEDCIWLSSIIKTMEATNLELKIQQLECDRRLELNLLKSFCEGYYPQEVLKRARILLDQFLELYFYIRFFIKVNT